jgi:uncharacterized protein YciI
MSETVSLAYLIAVHEHAELSRCAKDPLSLGWQGSGLTRRRLPAPLAQTTKVIIMLFAIHCLDHVDGLERRLANYDAHKAYLGSAEIKTIISGPLVAGDGETMIGSLFVVEADAAGDVIAFNANDPFALANVWRDVSINPFLMRVDNRK